MLTASMSDTDLQQDVLYELQWEPSVSAAHIGVTVKDGVVTLTGHVPSYAEKYGAEKAAKRVHGVQAVVDELDVKLPGDSRRHRRGCRHGVRGRPQGQRLGAARKDQDHGQSGLGNARRPSRLAVSEGRRRARRPLPDRRDGDHESDHGQAAWPRAS